MMKTRHAKARMKQLLCALTALALMPVTLPAFAARGQSIISGMTPYAIAAESQFAVNSLGTHRVTASALNVRSGPDTSYPSIDTLHRGDTVNVTALNGSFCRIASEYGRQGYVARQYLSPVSTPHPTPPPRPTPTARPQEQGRRIYIVNTAALNVRSGPSTNYPTLCQLHRGDKVAKVSALGDWMRVQLGDGRYGCVMARYIVYSHTEGSDLPPRPTYTAKPTLRPTSRPTAEPSAPTDAKIYVAVANINLRSGPSTLYSKKGIVFSGHKLTLIKKYSNEWYYVLTDSGTYGYVNSSYLRYAPAAGPTSTPAPTSGIVETDRALYSFEQMKADINSLYSRYPDMVTRRVSIGDTMWNEQIPAICIGNPNASKSLLIDGGIHGREYMSTLLIMHQIEYLLANKNTMYKGRTIGSMLDECCIWFIPMINPDGVRISQTGLAGLSSTKKNNLIALNKGSTYFARWKANGYGVDLNRNFETGWSYHGEPSAQDFSGSWANSESETRAMVAFVKSHTSIKASINYHTTGNYIYWHYGQTGAAKYRDKRIADGLSELTGFYLRAENYSGVGGGFMDWMIGSRGLPSFTIELGPGNIGAPQDIAYFPAIWNSNRNVPAFMLKYIIENL